MNGTIRVGIVGAGANTRAKHIPLLQKIDDVALVGVCNRSSESSRKVAEAFGIPKIYETWRDLVEDDAVDAVVIGTWPYLHCAVTCAALQAGKHVLCEARMAMNAAEAHQMLAEAAAHPELVTQVVPAPMSLDVDPVVMSLLADGYLGDLLSAHVRGCSAAFVDTASALTWRQDRTYSGFNTLAMGIWHEILQRWVGPASRVYASSRVFVPERSDPVTGNSTKVEVPDHVDIIADLTCGAQANYQFSAVTGLVLENGISLFGSAGTIVFSGNQLLIGKRGDRQLQPAELSAGRGGWRVEEEFIGAIRGEAPVRFTTFDDGVKYMEFTEAVYRSTMTGVAVGLPLEV